MKRLGRSTFMALVALLLIVTPTLAYAPTLNIDTSQCEQVSITATHRSGTSNMVVIRVDGTVVDGKTGWKTVSLTYTGSVGPGNHMAQVRYFERRWVNHEFVWRLMHMINRQFRIDACHEYSAVRRRTNNCEGWELYASIRDYGVEISREYLAFGIWTNPYIREVANRGVDYAKSYVVTLPDGSTVDLKMPKRIREPKRCTVPVDPGYGVSINYDGCDGYCAVVTPDQEGATVEYLTEPCGEWQDIRRTEEVTISFMIHQPDGSQELHEITVLEPTSCWRDPCRKEFKMWLLRGTHPDANGILECYVISPTHPSIERYQAICWPTRYPDFIASWAVSGYVDRCDVWELDNIRMYWRKPFKDLLDIYNR